MKKTTLFFVCFLISSMVFAQVQISPLKSNPALTTYVKPANQQAFRAQLNDTLPFLDDFSNNSLFPSANYWLDSLVFINNSFPINPVSVGVATFDGLNAKGTAYNNKNINASGLADELTSIPLQLGKYLGDSNTVFLSFYVQPQGNGAAPDKSDSLALEFYRMGSDTSYWQSVWRMKGTSFSNFKKTTGKDFLQVLIPINDTLYLKDGFQFRFRGYGSLTGNMDHWNLDYVYLNKGRSINDTIPNDIAFTSKISSLIKNYEAIPFNQFIESDLIDSSKSTVFNYFATPRGRQDYYITITDKVSGKIIPLDGDTIGLNFTPYAYNTIIFPDYNPSLSTLAGQDKAELEIRHTLLNTNDEIKSNDTIIRNTILSDYYAHDDGSAELNFGINGINSRLAYKFETRIADTLRAVDMFFTQADIDVSQRTFSIAVWKDLNSEPIFLLPNQSPRYKGSLDRFCRYQLGQDVIVDGVFYIGWIQDGIDFLNLGFDSNIDTKEKIFYNTNDTWRSFFTSGSLMMRPSFAEASSLLSVPAIAEKNLNIYPNPAQDKLYIQYSGTVKQIEIFDLLGKKVASYNSPESILDISKLASGMYLLKVLNNQSSVAVQRFVKN